VFLEKHSKGILGVKALSKKILYMNKEHTSLQWQENMIHIYSNHVNNEVENVVPLLMHFKLCTI
jgi:hypothetical protein